MKYIRKISLETQEKEVTSLPVKHTRSKSLKNEEKEVNSLSVKDCRKRRNVPVRVDVPESSSISFCDVESKSHDASRSPNTNNGINLGKGPLVQKFLYVEKFHSTVLLIMYISRCESKD